MWVYLGVGRVWVQVSHLISVDHMTIQALVVESKRVSYEGLSFMRVLQPLTHKGSDLTLGLNDTWLPQTGHKPAHAKD